MSEHFRTIPVAARAEEVERYAREQGVHHLLVVDDGEALGVVCLCDTSRVDPKTPVGQCMHSPFVFICTDWSADEALRLMSDCRIGFLPVLDQDGQVRGVLSRGDLRRAGLLPDEPGVDRCAACGTSHDLIHPNTSGGMTFCASCLDQVSSSLDEMYYTLGGGD
jgi:predicted transcriptional regulator